MGESSIVSRFREELFKSKVINDSERVVCESVVQPNFMLKKQWSPVLVTKLSSGRIVALAIDEEKSRGLTRVNFPDVACNWRMYEVRPSKPDVGKIHKV